jgi:hypothetical protein
MMDTMRQSKGRPGEEALLEVYRTQSLSFAPSQIPANYGGHVNQFIAQSWPPQHSMMWNEAYSSQFNWRAAPAPPASDVLSQEALLYTSDDSNLRSPRYKYEPSPSFNAGVASYPQPYGRPINHVSPDYGTTCPSQTPQASIQPQPLYTNIPPSDATEYSPQFAYGMDLHPKLYDAAWIPIGNEPDRSTHVISDPFPDLATPEATSKGMTLDWSTSNQVSGLSTASNNTSYQAIVPKRKYTSPEPVAKKSKSTSTQDELDEFVVVFENAPGALATIKRRKKLDAPVRKAARDVRKAGACHQCRFRKRTVSQVNV